MDWTNLQADVGGRQTGPTGAVRHARVSDVVTIVRIEICLEIRHRFDLSVGSVGPTLPVLTTSQLTEHQAAELRKSATAHEYCPRSTHNMTRVGPVVSTVGNTVKMPPALRTLFHMLRGDAADKLVRPEVTAVIHDSPKRDLILSSLGARLFPGSTHAGQFLGPSANMGKLYLP
ncbi:hypothetical protein Bbelb_267100 [Branchiostoma belcheri]|nr:hypothetical protein Bbelb_267100 [Branchiostoma belcheri]